MPYIATDTTILPAVALTADGGRARATPAQTFEVVDTVGAGDAFAAVCLLGILREWSSYEIISRAQAFASRVVGQRGATSADKSLYAPFISAWSL